MDKDNVFQDLLLESKNKYSLELASFIIKAVGMYYKLEKEYHLKKTRAREIVQARQMSMYMIRKYTDMSLKQVAALFNQDHATVIHGVTKINDYCSYDKNTRNEKKDIEFIIRYRAEAIEKNADWRKEYFFLDLNKMYSLNFDNNKAILLAGYTKLEALNLQDALRGESDLKEHKRTGMYILEKKQTEDESKQDDNS